MQSHWTKSRDRKAGYVYMPTSTERTASGKDDRHLTWSGRVEKRLEQLRERRERMNAKQT
jgi:hypothetical protein